MLNYYIPVTQIFYNSLNSSEKKLSSHHLKSMYDETMSSEKTMIPELILQLVINQFGSTAALFEEINRLNSEWIVLLFNQKTMRIALKSATEHINSSQICLIVKHGDGFQKIDWDIVRNRYNQIIKLQ